MWVQGDVDRLVLVVAVWRVDAIEAGPRDEIPRIPRILAGVQIGHHDAVRLGQLQIDALDGKMSSQIEHKIGRAARILLTEDRYFLPAGLGMPLGELRLHLRHGKARNAIDPREPPKLRSTGRQLDPRLQ